MLITVRTGSATPWAIPDEAGELFGNTNHRIALHLRDFVYARININIPTALDGAWLGIQYQDGVTWRAFTGQPVSLALSGVIVGPWGLIDRSILGPICIEDIHDGGATAVLRLVAWGGNNLSPVTFNGIYIELA